MDCAARGQLKHVLGFHLDQAFKLFFGKYSGPYGLKNHRDSLGGSKP